MTENQKARLAADVFFETSGDEIDAAKIASELGEAAPAFFERLAARAAIAAAVDDDIEDFEPSPSFLAKMREAYDEENAARPSNTVDLSKPSTWIEAKDAFGGDKGMGLIIKFTRATVTDIPDRFLRYVSDVFGLTMATARSHFLLPSANSMATVERKASGTQSGPATENFENAVNASEISDDLKARWLKG